MHNAGKLKFAEARSKCQQLGADLASLHSKGEIEFVKGTPPIGSFYLVMTVMVFQKGKIMNAEKTSSACTKEFT